MKGVTGDVAVAGRLEKKGDFFWRVFYVTIGPNTNVALTTGGDERPSSIIDQLKSS